MPSASIVPFMSGSTRSLNAEMKLKVSLGILWSFELSGYVKKLWCVLRLGSARTVNEYHSLYLTDRPERVEARVSATFQTDSRSTLQFESAFGKQLLDFHLSRRQ